MAKVAIKCDNIVPYGRIFYAMNEFRRTCLDGDKPVPSPIPTVGLVHVVKRRL